MPDLTDELSSRYGKGPLMVQIRQEVKSGLAPRAIDQHNWEQGATGRV